MRNFIPNFALLPMLGLSALAMPSHALDFSLDVGYEASYSTNSDQVATDEVEQWIHEPSVSIGLSHDSATVEFDSDYDLSRRIYEEDDGARFGDETILTGETFLNWQVVPDRLSFGVEHFRREQTIDASISGSPMNRQESQLASGNITYTQPTIGSQYMILTGTSSATRFEETDNDSKTEELRLAYAVPLSESRRWQVMARRAETTFDDFEMFDYQLDSAEVQFFSEAPTGRLEASLGYSKTDPDSPAIESVSGVTGSLDFQRGISTPLQWGVVLAREIGDRSMSLDGGGVTREGELDLLDSGLADVFTSTRAAFNVISRRGSNALFLTVETDQEEYETALEDRDVAMITVRFERRVRANLNFASSISYAETDFDDLDQEDEFFDASMQLSWDVNRRLQIGTSLTYQQRDSSNTFAEFDEWIGTVFASYALFNNRP